MAGGAGERFWPLSRQRYPKQLLKIAGNHSMLTEAARRVSGLVAPDDIFVVTGNLLRDAIIAETSGIPAENIIGEPEGKNTAACLALACAFLEQRYASEPDVCMIVLTADHFIRDVDSFTRDASRLFDCAENHAVLATFGISPTRPETGYGYIETGNILSDHPQVMRVASFREKPNLETAIEFQRSGNFLWNSGMFVWRNSVLRTAFRQHLPEMEAQIPALATAFKSPSPEQALATAFAPMQKISIDVGVMERTHNAVVLRATFDWDDVGTWASLGRLLASDTDNNVQFGNAALVECANCIVYNADSANPNERLPLVVGFGLEDLVVVQMRDAVLVMPRDRVQRVKDIVAQLRESGREEYL